MIQSNTVSPTTSPVRMLRLCLNDYYYTNDPKYSKKSIFKQFFFMLDQIIVFNMIHLRSFERKIVSKHFQLFRISFQKLNIHGISRFSAVFIINNLNALRRFLMKNQPVEHCMKNFLVIYIFDRNNVKQKTSTHE
jgi:hypothetical protein